MRWYSRLRNFWERHPRIRWSLIVVDSFEGWLCRLLRPGLSFHRESGSWTLGLQTSWCWSSAGDGGARGQGLRSKASVGVLLRVCGLQSQSITVAIEGSLQRPDASLVIGVVFMPASVDGWWSCHWWGQWWSWYYFRPSCWIVDADVVNVEIASFHWSHMLEWPLRVTLVALSLNVSWVGSSRRWNGCWGFLGQCLSLDGSGVSYMRPSAFEGRKKRVRRWMQMQSRVMKQNKRSQRRHRYCFSTRQPANSIIEHRFLTRHVIALAGDCE